MIWFCSTRTECFYNKDGKWYYAGVYKAFRLEDLSIKEWETLSNEVRMDDILFIDQMIQGYRVLVDLSNASERDNCFPQEHVPSEFLRNLAALRRWRLEGSLCWTSVRWLQQHPIPNYLCPEWEVEGMCRGKFWRTVWSGKWHRVELERSGWRGRCR